MTATPPRPDVAERTCGKCGKIKPIRKGARSCSECQGLKKGGKRFKPPPTTHTSFEESPGGLGFRIQLEVDENTGKTDIRVEQDNATAGVQTHWFSQAEARRIQAWLERQLGKL